MRYWVWAACLLVASTASASTVRHVELEELVRTSHVVVRAHVAFVDDRAGESEGKFKTRIGFEVDEAVKGLEGATTYELVVRGGKNKAYTMAIPGMPHFVPGEEVVLLVTHTAGGDVINGLGEGVYAVDRTGTEARVRQPFIRASHVVDAQGREVTNAAVETTLTTLMTRIRSAAVAGGAQ